MTDRPILLSAPMILALLAGTKTQTRRGLKTKPHWENIPPLATWRFSSGYKTTKADPPWMEATIPTSYGATEILANTRVAARIGDRLWVRENGHLLREAFEHDPRSGEDVWRDAGFCHAADGAIVPARAYDPPLSEWAGDCARISRPSIHMPRWASRLTLTVTDVRVQRLQDISGNDAQAEGISIGGPDVDVYRREADRNHEAARRWNAYRIRQYRDLWDSINGAGSWAANPWIVAYSFTVARRNIDAEG